jgi:uncharacterized MAPEG superfamily protein
MKLQLVMNTDMRLLVYTAFVCIVVWAPYIVAAIRAYGLKRMAGAYPTPSYASLPQWAQRLHRAHMNLVENIGPFAALVIVAQLTGAANAMTALGAQLFFYARLVQIVAHTAGIPWVRTGAFAVGWIGNLIILVQILER